MPTHNPRVNVTFNPDDAEILKLICQKKKMSLSGLVRRVTEEWLEDYEDLLLARRAEKILDDWEKGGRKTISHEEMWARLDSE